MRFQLRVKNWRSYLPIFEVLKDYRKDDFNHDLLAGVVVGVVSVPQAIAYAFLAGLPAEAGLYACLAPMVLYAILGSSRQLAVGPVAVNSLMTAVALATYGPDYGNAHLAMTAVLSIEAGLFLWLLRLLHMGGLVNLLSQPVIIGFVNAAAVLIIMSQVPTFAGVHDTPPHVSMTSFWSIPALIETIDPLTFAVGAGSLATLWIIQRHGAQALRLVGLNIPNGHPFERSGPLVVTVLATLAVMFWNLDTEYGIGVVGAIAAGLPSIAAPPFDPGMWRDLASPAAMIAIVSYVESYSIGATMATRRRTRVNAHQELIALGAANIGAAFTGAYPVAGSFSRSSVNFQTGARSQISSLISLAVIIITLLFLTAVLARVPTAALAAIIVISVLGIMDFASFFRHWRVNRDDSVIELVTFGTVIGFGIESGLVTGVALSIAFFVRQSSRPHITLVGRIGDSGQFRNIDRYETETFPHIAAIRIDENIFFANANQIENKLLKYVQRRPDTEHVLLVMSAVNRVDVSGLEMLYRVNGTFQAMGIKLHLSDVKGPVMNQLQATNFISELAGTVYFSTDQAMRDLANRR